MITSIILKNFQAHKRTKILPAKGLTSITGRSDHGKTSIIRAVKKVKTNKPTGKNFIRHHTDLASITIDDVKMSIGASAQYKVKGYDKPFKAIGTGQPPVEVTDNLNIAPESIQEQIRESIFLLDVSPGKVAQKLSVLVDLQQATDSLAYIKKRKTKATNTLFGIDASIEETQNTINELEYIEDINKEYAKIERKRAKIERLKQSEGELLVAVQKVRDEQATLNEMPNLDVIIPKLDSMITKAEEIQKLECELVDIQDARDEVVSIEDLVSLDPTDLIKRFDEIFDLQEKQWEIEVARRAIIGGEAIVEQVKIDEARHQAAWDAMKGEECPTCGGIIGE